MMQAVILCTSLREMSTTKNARQLKKDIMTKMKNESEKKHGNICMQTQSNV